MKCKELANIIVTEVSVHILLMTPNYSALNFRRKKPQCYLESNDLYLFPSDHTSLEKILGKRHEILYLLGKTPLCDSSQVTLSFSQTKTNRVPRQTGTREKRLTGGLSHLGLIF